MDTTKYHKLSPLTVSFLRPEDKGGDIDVNIGDPIWVCKNNNGKYLKPYKVIVQSNKMFDGEVTYGFLALVETHIENYFTCFTNMDIIGSSEEDVKNKCDKILSKQKELTEERNKLLKGFIL